VAYFVSITLDVPINLGS